MLKIHLGLAFTVGAVMQFAVAGQQAVAADLPTISMKDTPYVSIPYWGGLYFGGHAGGVWGNTNVHDHFDYSGDPEFNGSATSLGLIAGLQAGYNIQRGHAVFGLEGDVGYLGTSANLGKNFNDRTYCKSTYSKDGKDFQEYTTANGGAPMCNINSQYSSSSDIYADLTARVGYAMDRTLLYVKGGAAILNVNANAAYEGQNCVTTNQPGCSDAKHVGTSNFNYDNSGMLFGWTIGAGAEYALTPSWSLKAEYQHFDFGKMSYSYTGCVSMEKPGFPGCPPQSQAYANHYTSQLKGNTDVSVTADAVKLGLNYHLGEH